MDVKLIHRKQSIIISTIEAMSEVGLQKLSTREIAKRQSISEGTLFRHFKNKTDILISVLEYFAQYDDHIIKTSINKKLNSKDTIIYVMEVYSIYYENYPEITAIIQNYDALMCDINLRDKVISIITKRRNFLLKNIEKACKEGVINDNVDCEVLVDLILGGARAICLNWRMEGYKFSLKDRIMNMINMIIESFFKINISNHL